jgi:putative spermidine/putrescine transport system ATP-binding protein
MATNEVATAAGTAAVAAGGPAAGAREGTSVSLRELTRAFGPARALDGMSLEIAPGELVALLGPSGCGKTTALRIVAGFETADTGEVLVDGRDVSGRPAARRDMGMVFQSYSLFPNMSALDNVGFGLRMRKASATVRRQKAGELLEMVGLSAQSGQFPHQLSGGQQQRVAIARALVNEPTLILADEPTGNLDTRTSIEVMNLLQDLRERRTITVVLITHDMDIAKYGTRIIAIRDGQIVSDKANTPTRGLEVESPRIAANA